MSATQPRLAFDPYPEQREVLDSDARFRVVAAGRRSGKTMLAAVESVRRALRGGDGWHGYWVGAEHHHAETAFTLFDKALPNELTETRKRSPPRTIEFTSGAVQEFHTAGGGDLVSIGLDWVVCDEAGKDFPERTWTQELRPALSDRDGDAMFISTPDGKDWFHDWFQRGQSDDHSDVKSWRWATYANPHVPDSEVEAAEGELPQRIFEQEYLARFRDDTGGVFDTDAATLEYTLPDDATPHWAATPPFRMAADLARSEDYLAIVTLDTYGNVAHLTRERDLSWPTIQRRIETVAAAHGHPRVAIDATRDNKLVADLEASGLDVEPVKFSSRRKQDLVENLAAGIEHGEVTVPEGSILTAELSVFEFETTRAGNVRYSAPEGHHDDTVDALAMAYDLRESGTPTATVTFGNDDETGGKTESFRESPFGEVVSQYQKQHRGRR